MNDKHGYFQIVPVEIINKRGEFLEVQYLTNKDVKLLY